MQVRHASALVDQIRKAVIDILDGNEDYSAEVSGDFYENDNMHLSLKLHDRDMGGMVYTIEVDISKTGDMEAFEPFLTFGDLAAINPVQVSYLSAMIVAVMILSQHICGLLNAIVPTILRIENVRNN